MESLCLCDQAQQNGKYKSEAGELVCLWHVH